MLKNEEEEEETSEGRNPDDEDQSGLFLRLLAKDKQIVELTRVNRLLEQEKSSVECLLRVSSEQLRKLQEEINSQRENSDQSIQNYGNASKQQVKSDKSQLEIAHQLERITELTEQCMQLESSVVKAHEVIAHYQAEEQNASAKQKKLKKERKALEKELAEVKEMNANLQEQLAVKKEEQRVQLIENAGVIEVLQKKIQEYAEEISKLQEDKEAEVNMLRLEFEQTQQEIVANHSVKTARCKEELVGIQQALLDLRQEHAKVLQVKEELEKNANYLKIDNITLRDKLKRMNGISSNGSIHATTHGSSFIQQQQQCSIPPRSKLPSHKRSNSSSSQQQQQQLYLDHLSLATPTQHLHSLSVNQPTSSSSVHTTTTGLGANRNSTVLAYPKMMMSNYPAQLQLQQHLQEQSIISGGKNILTFAGNHNNNNNSYGTIDDQQQTLQQPLGIQNHCKPATVAAGNYVHNGNFQQDMSGSQWNSMYATIDQTSQLGELAHNARERSIDACELSSILSKTIVSPLRGQMWNKSTDKLLDITKELSKEIQRLAQSLAKGQDGRRSTWNQCISTVNMVLAKAENECKKFSGISSFNENDGQQEKQQQQPYSHIVLISILESTRQLLSLFQFSLSQNANTPDQSKNIFFNTTKHNQALNLPSQHLHHTPDQEIKHLLTELQELNGETYDSCQLQQLQGQEQNNSKYNPNYQLLRCVLSALINLLSNPISTHKGIDKTPTSEAVDNLKSLERQLPNSIQPYLQNLVNQIVSLKTRNQEIQRELTKLQLTNRNVRGIRPEQLQQ